MKGDSIVALLTAEPINEDFDSVLKVSDVRTWNNGTEHNNILVDDNYRGGESWVSAKKGKGSYCHCTQITPDLTNIEYWLLFGFNEFRADPVSEAIKSFDHPGDLICIQMVYSQESDSIIRVAFNIHGHTVEAFDIPATPSYISTRLGGRDIKRNKMTHTVQKINILTKAHYQKGPEIHHPSDPYIFFSPDPESNKYEHLVVFFEWGTHEPWPNNSGSISFAPNHNGMAYSFLPDKVTLLDPVVDAPFLYFGGRLGDPVGIMRHRSWLCDDLSINIHSDKRVDKNIYEQLGYLRWPPIYSP